MGSWYNLVGEDLSNCINSKCGQRPIQPMGMIVSPQEEAEYSAKMSAWNTCRESCEKARFNLAGVGTLGSINTSGVMPVGNITTVTPTGGTAPVGKENADVKPLGIGVPLAKPAGISKNTILIGVGVLAVVAFLAFRK